MLAPRRVGVGVDLAVECRRPGPISRRLAAAFFGSGSRTGHHHDLIRVNFRTTFSIESFENVERVVSGNVTTLAGSRDLVILPCTALWYAPCRTGRLDRVPRRVV